MTTTPQQLLQIQDRINNGDTLTFTTPRELLGWFGQYRRTWRHVKTLRTELNNLGLETFPDFEGAGFDEPILIQKVDLTPPSPTNSANVEIGASTESQPSEQTDQQVADPVHRVSRFVAIGTLVTVARDEKIQVAITKMMLHDFSQLPVMQGDMKVQGMISWRSIGQKNAVGCEPIYVRECLEPHSELKAESSIFEAIRLIKERDCVLVRSKENKITGILTAADISESFEQVSKPFMLLSYIENHLRVLIQPKFTPQELQFAKDPADTARVISDVSDMTFGEYVRLLEAPDNWEKLGIAIERSLFIEQLHGVREIRNDVMHFNPEGIEDKDLILLRRFSDFLESIVTLMPKK